MKSLVFALAAAVLLAGCTFTPDALIEPQQRASISAIALKNAQLITPFSVEYQQTDTASAGVFGGVVGVAVSHAVSAPGNRKVKMGALIKARAFNQLIGPFNSTDVLETDLGDALERAGYSVREKSEITLHYQMFNCLSEDTKTLQVHTAYEVSNSSGNVLLDNDVRVQYTVAKNWDESKLQLAVRSAIQESSRLIAADISGGISIAAQSLTPYVAGSKKYTSNASLIQSPSSENYLSLRFPGGSLVSIAGESEELVVRSFQGQDPHCR